MPADVRSGRTRWLRPSQSLTCPSRSRIDAAGRNTLTNGRGRRARATARRRCRRSAARGARARRRARRGADRPRPDTGRRARASAAARTMSIASRPASVIITGPQTRSSSSRSPGSSRRRPPGPSAGWTPAARAPRSPARRVASTNRAPVVLGRGERGGGGARALTGDHHAAPVRVAERRERGVERRVGAARQQPRLVTRAGRATCSATSRQPRLARVHDDDPGATTGRLAQPQVQDRDLLLGVQADHDDHGRALEVAIGDGARRGRSPSAPPRRSTATGWATRRWSRSFVPSTVRASFDRA